MAEAPRSLELLLSCSICFEEFEENGDHVPRILPCTHTLCENCIKQLIQDNKLQCPECKAEHKVTNQTNKERSFPQNKFLLPMIKIKVEKKDEEVEEYGKCEVHGKELSLFCAEEGCRKPICKKCLNDHRRHAVVQIEEEKIEELVANLKEVEKKLEKKLMKVVKIKNDVATKAQICKEEIQREKAEAMTMFDVMIEESEKMKIEVVEEVENEISTVGDNLTLLRSLKGVATEEDTLGDIMNKLELVNDIAEHSNMSRNFAYPEYQKTEAVREAMFGAVMKRELKMEPTGDDVTDDVSDDVMTITSTSQLKYKVVESLQTRFNWFHMDLVDHNSVFVCGLEYGCYMLKRLDLQTGGELGSVDLGFYPYGLAVVELSGRKTMAVSDSGNKKIQFRDINNLQAVIYIHQMGPHQPGRLCVSSPSTLLCSDMSKNPREVHMLDCSGAELKSMEGKNIIKTQSFGIRDMYIVRGGDRELLVCVDSNMRLEAYNMRTDELEWRVKGIVDAMQRDIDPWAVTTDGRGHLFVCDKNNKCIQMFHVADGRYLGALQVEGGQVFETPYGIIWCEETSSLVVACNSLGHRVLHKVSVKRD